MSETSPPPPRSKVIATIEALSAGSGVLAAVCLFTLFALMLAEVIARNLFGESLHVTWELSSYMMGAVFFLGASATMKAGEHVRVGILLEILPDSAACTLDLLVTIAAFAIAAYIAYAVGGLTFRSLSGDVRSWTGYRIPLAIPQAVLTVGALLLALQLVARALRIIGRLPADEKRVDPVSQ